MPTLFTMTGAILNRADIGYTSRLSHDIKMGTRSGKLGEFIHAELIEVCDRIDDPQEKAMIAASAINRAKNDLECVLLELNNFCDQLAKE